MEFDNVKSLNIKWNHTGVSVSFELMDGIREQPQQPPVTNPVVPPVVSPVPISPNYGGLSARLIPKENNIYPFGFGDNLAIPFDSGPARGVDVISIGEYGEQPSVKFVKLSAVPFDFDHTQGFNGSTSIGNKGGVYFSVGQSNGNGYMVLEPNTTYYLNVSDINPFTGQNGCTVGSCQFVAV